MKIGAVIAVIAAAGIAGGVVIYKSVNRFDLTVAGDSISKEEYVNCMNSVEYDTKMQIQQDYDAVYGTDFWEKQYDGQYGYEILTRNTVEQLKYIHAVYDLVLRHAGGWGWGIFAFVWLSAIAGFILSFKKLKEHSNLETACYVGMGACILVAMKPLLDHLAELGATTAFWWLIGGGVSYIVGAVFYSLRKPYMHATFHLFCLGGSIGHIIAIWLIL